MLTMFFDYEGIVYQVCSNGISNTEENFIAICKILYAEKDPDSKDSRQLETAS